MTTLIIEQDFISAFIRHTIILIMILGIMIGITMIGIILITVILGMAIHITDLIGTDIHIMDPTGMVIIIITVIITRQELIEVDTIQLL